MKKIIRLTESNLVYIIKKVLNEQGEVGPNDVINTISSAVFGKRKNPYDQVVDPSLNTTTTQTPQNTKNDEDAKKLYQIQIKKIDDWLIKNPKVFANKIPSGKWEKFGTDKIKLSYLFKSDKDFAPKDVFLIDIPITKETPQKQSGTWSYQNKTLKLV